MFYEGRVSTKWNHEHHETISTEGMTIQRYSESKFVDKAQLKRRSSRVPNPIQLSLTLKQTYVIPHVKFYMCNMSFHM